MRTHWRLPRGVDELLPPAAWELEQLRRRVLDVFVSWGFEYIEPPVIEYLDSLLVGSGEDLDLQTLKVVDQVSGIQLGVRADMTSQALRIDAHSLITDQVQRLCYCGPVVFANPLIAQSSRVPFKAGAEIFGCDSLEADAEVVMLMIEALRAAGISEPVLLLGHMAIYRGLVNQLLADGALQQQDERALFKCVQRKSQADIAALLDDSPLANMLAELPGLMGDVTTLDRVRACLQHAPAQVLAAVDELETLATLVAGSNQEVVVRLDVAELSGYGYHNGPVFAVYHPQHGRALAQGGRYDNAGAVFGRARAATGFDLDLKNLIEATPPSDIVFAPFVEAAERHALQQAVRQLRQSGERVRCALSAQEGVPQDSARMLAQVDGAWQVVSVSGK